MMTNNDIREIVKLGIDTYKGTPEKYSLKQSNETMREALIEANNGSTKLDYKAIRDGKCPNLFAIVEEILNVITIAGLQESDIFNTFVDFRNLAEGDEASFVVEDSNVFTIAEAANGTQGIRRQRISGATTTTVPTTLKVVKIFDELSRILAGRVDFDAQIKKVGDSFAQAILNDINKLWAGLNSTNLGGAAYYPVAGSYSEDALLGVIEQVEAAANGGNAMLIGTKKALFEAVPSIQADAYKDNMYNIGYAGKFYGTPCFALPQRYKYGTTTLAFDDDVITVVAGADKPFKCVYEGNPLIIMGDPLQNADLTQEYLYANKWGTALVLAGRNTGIGRYEFT